MAPSLEQRRARPDPRFVLCVTAVIGLHAALLLHTARDARHFAPPAAMNVRSLNPTEPSPAQTLAPPETAAALPSSALQPLPQSQLALPDSAASHEDALAPELRYPDAGLPGGETRAEVALSLAVDGFVEGLRIAPHALPPAFEKAVQHAFAGSKLNLEQRGGQLEAGLLCIEVHFREGAPPDWHPLVASGICAG